MKRRYSLTWDDGFNVEIEASSKIFALCKVAKVKPIYTSYTFDGIRSSKHSPDNYNEWHYLGYHPTDNVGFVLDAEKQNYRVVIVG